MINEVLRAAKLKIKKKYIAAIEKLINGLVNIKEKVEVVK